MHLGRQHILGLGLVAGVSLLFVGLAAPAQGQEPAPANSISVSLEPDPIGGRNLLLTVEATEVTDLYALSFDLSFPKKRLRWKKKTKQAGAFLSAEETVETFVVHKQKPRGLLHVGATRLGEVEGVTGSGVLVEIGFVNRKKAGPRELVLIEPKAFGSDAEPIEDIVWEVVPFQDESGS